MTMLMPVKVETFEDHFTDNSWDSPQDQIDAGYPLFIQPSASTAQYVHTHDLGAELTTAHLITLNLAKTDVVSGITITPTISISDDNSTWTDYAGVDSVFASNFRYIKITLNASGGGTALTRVSEVRVVVSIKELRDGGTGYANSGDTGGTTVTFNKTFVDIDGINVTAAHQAGETKGITAVYNFTDSPNPTSFTVLLFSNNTGSRINGDFSWSAKGS